MDLRQQKARELADRARITSKDGCWSVPSQSGSGSYTVILDEQDSACDCPDYELRGRPCKHIRAIRLFLQRQDRGGEQDTANVAPSPKAPRKSYPQDWVAYNAAQVNEQGHLQD